MIDILVAAFIVFVAYLIFKSLAAVLIALLCVAVAVYIVRAAGIYPRRRG